jgi:toxin ParE1/3/4
MVNLIILPEAAAEYDDAHDQYSAISPQLAVEFESRFGQAIQFITTTPNLGSRYDRQHRFYVMHQFPYLVYYRYQSGTVTVVAVAHSARRPGYWKGR